MNTSKNPYKQALMTVERKIEEGTQEQRLQII